MSYEPHDRLVNAARAGRDGLGTLLMGFVSIAALAYLTSNLFYGTLYGIVAPEDPNWLSGGTTAGGMLALLFGFGAWIVAIALTVILIHRRAFSGLLGAGSVPQFRKVLWAVILLHAVVMFLPPWTITEGVTPARPFGQWATLLPVALIAVFIQVSAEELLFRGYLQSQLAARFKSPLVWIGVPTVLFAMGHYNPEAGENAWVFVIWAAVFGALMADLTARSGALGPAIAVHMVNNIFALLILSPPDTMSGLALYHYPFALSDAAAVRALLPIDFAMLFLMWLAARLALRP